MLGIAPTETQLSYNPLQAVGRGASMTWGIVAKTGHYVGRLIEEAAPSGIWSGTILHISTIPLFAAIAGISLLLRDKSDEMQPADLAVGVIFLLLSVFSVGALNWVAVRIFEVLGSVRPTYVTRTCCELTCETHV